MNDILSRFKKNQNILGEHYLEIGSNFNELMKELDNSLSACRGIVMDFKHQVDSEDDASLRKRIQGMESLVEKETRNYHELMAASTGVLVRVTDSFTMLNEIETPVREIQDAADLMALLALNSMVVAIQAGNKGGGFTCITEELKQASASTYQTSEEIQANAQRVTSSYHEFTALADRIRNFEEEIRRCLDEELRIGFQNSYKLISEYVGFMESLESRSMLVKPMLMKLMESIQNQDIIRQSMDHIILSLQELEEYHDLEDVERVGFLLLKKQIYTLSNAVLKDIKRWLESDLTSLEESILGCRGILEEINTGKTDFLNRQRDETDDARGFSRQVLIIQDSIGDILAKNEAAGRLRKKLQLENLKLLGSVEGLESRSQGFQKIISLFRNINVMARIEIARTDVFKNIQNAVSEMEGINERIEKAVNSIYTINHGVMEKNNENDRQFLEILEKNQRFESVFKNDIGALLSLLKDSIHILDGALCDFNAMSSGFINIFNGSEKSVGKINESYQELLVMDDAICEEILQIDRELSTLDPNEDHLAENQKRIEKILSQFTIYRHKQEAGKLAGLHFQDEGNAEESSVVLF